MEGIFQALLTWGLPGVLLLIVLYLVSHPETAYKWGEILAVLLAKIRRSWDRRAVRWGLQRELDAFTVELAKQTGRSKPPPVLVGWTNASEEPEHFHSDGRLVIRLHEHEHQDRNLVTAAQLVVSQNVARRAKRFLALKQARSTDLYAVDRLLRRIPDALDLFREEVMGPEVDADKEIRRLIEAFQEMDQAQFFFPVYVRELDHLGQEVVIPPRDERLIVDVDRLIDFLVRFAQRTVGEEKTDRVLQGSVLRCAIFIVAQSHRRESGLVEQPLKVLRGFAGAGMKTIYVIGSAAPDNKKYLNRVVGAFLQSEAWRAMGQRDYTGTLHKPDGSSERSKSCMLVLRYPGDQSLDED